MIDWWSGPSAMAGMRQVVESSKEETTVDFRHTQVYFSHSRQFSSTPTMAARMHRSVNQCCLGHKENTLSLQSDQHSGQQNGWHLCFLTHMSTIFSAITKFIKSLKKIRWKLKLHSFKRWKRNVQTWLNYFTRVVSVVVSIQLHTCCN